MQVSGLFHDDPEITILEVDRHTQPHLTCHYVCLHDGPLASLGESDALPDRQTSRKTHYKKNDNQPCAKNYFFIDFMSSPPSEDIVFKM